MKIERYAGIDIGSNGVRLLIMNIYEIQGNVEFDKAILVRAPVRLGSDSFVRNEIQEDSILMLIEAMKSFYSLMKCYNVIHYKAYATSALREAINSEKVIQRVLEQSHIPIELIDGKVEAEIIYKTQISQYIKDSKGYLFIDVGGGSTEVTYYNNYKAVASKSFKIGTVRLLKNQVEHSEWIELESYLNSLTISKDTVAVGTGGNINSLFKKSQTSIGKPLSLNYLIDKYDELKRMTVDERIIEYKFNPDRADVIVPALEVYTKIMNISKIDEIYVPKIGLADGIIRTLYSEMRNSQ